MDRLQVLKILDKNMELELETEIHYLPTEEGGRKHGIASGYRGQFYYYGRDWCASQQLMDREICQPGETARVCLSLLTPENHLGMFHVGQEFEIREGARIVAKGVIRKILCPDLECRVDWGQLKESLYYEDGSLRDIYVSDTTEDDWQKWMEWVQRTYPTEWFDHQTKTPADAVDFAAISNHWQNENQTRLLPTLKVFLEHIPINTHFFIANEIENDINPADIKTWGDHVRLLNYMKVMSYVLDKPVVLTPENMPDHVLMTINEGKKSR